MPRVRSVFQGPSAPFGGSDVQRQLESIAGDMKVTAAMLMKIVSEGVDVK